MLFKRTKLSVFTVIAFCIASVPAYATDQNTDDINKLLDAPIQDLPNMEVTSVSKRAEKASEAAAAIYVITQEDIRRSGLNSIPELLRLAPGIQVSRINSGWWAITARGNAAAFGNKLLVLIDGRSIYNPLFSGVLWEEQGTPIEDIERIEVIRGPGSTLYGANAVNGVINIITKNSKDTQGSLVSAGGGTYENYSGLYQYGGRVSSTDTYRTYINNYRQDDSLTSNGDKNHDDFDMSRTGFRYDGGSKDNSTAYTFSGDAYKGKRDVDFSQLPALNAAGFTDTLENHSLYGGDVIGKYNKKMDNNSDLQLQAYYDYTGRDAETFGYQIQTLDLDAQHNINLSENHEFMYGLGYRMVYADLDDSEDIFYRQNYITTNLFSGFAQDKIQLLPDELFLTLGSKLEHNSFTGFEVEPNARVTWLPTQTQTVWGAITRAVRTPSIAERFATQAAGAIPGPGGFLSLTGDDDFGSEKLVAYELGYRNQVTKNVSVDVSTYLNDYQDLRTFEYNGPIAPEDIAASFKTENRGYGISRGIEISSNWKVNKQWDLTGSYTYLNMNIKLDPGSTDIVGKADDGTSPNNMFNIRSHYSFSDEWETDESLYYAGSLHGAATDSHDVNSYIRFDARLGYKPYKGVELSLVGQNLFDHSHQEFGSAPYSQPAEIPRSAFGKVTFRF